MLTRDNINAYKQNRKRGQNEPVQLPDDLAEIVTKRPHFKIAGLCSPDIYKEM